MQQDVKIKCQVFCAFVMFQKLLAYTTLSIIYVVKIQNVWRKNTKQRSEKEKIKPENRKFKLDSFKTAVKQTKNKIYENSLRVEWFLDEKWFKIWFWQQLLFFRSLSLSFVFVVFAFVAHFFFGSVFFMWK